MGMATNTAGDQARRQPRQVVNTLRFTVNFNTTGISSGVKVGTLPLGAFITQVLAEVVTAFDAGSTNVLTVGTNASDYNNIIDADDVTEGTPGVYACTTGLGRSLTASAAVDVYAKYAQTGDAAEAGQAVIVISFEGNNG